MSNNGKVTKIFYSLNLKISSLIVEAVNVWPYGYCEFTSSPNDINDEDWDKWLVEIPECGTESSIKAIIDAYMHLGCGFSFADIFKPEIDEWIAAGEQYQSVIIASEFKSLSYELYHTINQLESRLYEKNEEIKAIMVTAIGKHISIADYSLFASIVKSQKFYSLANGCHFDEDTTVYLKLHISTGPTTNNSLFEVPAFLRRKS